MPLSPLSLIPGRVYRAQKPRCSKGYFNDRQIIWVNDAQVQYDGPAVTTGRSYPIIAITDFLKWASHDVTELLPEDGWQAWKN